jgi:sialate O-acetylesterase
MKSLPVFLLLLLSNLEHVLATVTLPSFFGDNMVLQQKTEASIWDGQAGNQHPDTHFLEQKKYQVSSDANDRWKTKLATPSAGGPFEITISDGKPLTIKNV